MVGAIIGDIVGSVYERHPIKTTDFPLFSKSSRFTDDTILTCAIADAIMHGRAYPDALREYARRYPDAGYGMKFLAWAMFDQAQQFSFGNGAAMRVSPVAWAFNNIEEVLDEARKSCLPSHDHPEAIKGAQAVAAAVFLTRTGSTKDQLKLYITDRTDYDLATPIKVIRPDYRFDATCRGSVPIALRAFLEADSFEEAVRLAVSLGGDSDTLACMAGAVAEAAFGVPEWIRTEAMRRLDDPLRRIVEEFREFTGSKR